MTPATQLETFIARFDPAIAKLARSSRAALSKRMPTAQQLVYDNYNALAIGFGPSERPSDCIVSLAIYARGVNLYFLYGASLPDPKGILEGKGNRGRFVRLTSAGDLERPEVAALLAAAIADSDVAMPTSGRGKTIIRSVSAKQRARRSR
jgi:hypothetical protein